MHLNVSLIIMFPQDDLLQNIFCPRAEKPMKSETELKKYLDIK